MENLLHHADYSDCGSVLVRTEHDPFTGIDHPSEIILKPSSNNKDIIQSYIITTAKYAFSVYEKRILYRIIECLQYQLEGKELKNFSVCTSLRGVDIVLPISSLRADSEDENYSCIKNAIKCLHKRLIEYEDHKIWKEVTLIASPKVNKYSRVVSFFIFKEVYEALLDFSKGYSKYEIRTAMFSFRSKYAMRLYELLSGQRNPITYSVDYLKSIFKLENKYKLLKDFIFRVIEPAKKELDVKSPYSFTYELVYEKERKHIGRKKIIAIAFTPVYNKENRDPLLALRERQREYDLSDALIPEELNALHSVGFTDEELKKCHCNLLHDIGRARRQGKIILTPVMTEYAKIKDNPKTYLIRALKNEVKKYKEALLESKPNKLSREEMLEAEKYISKKSGIESFLRNMLALSGDELSKGLAFVLEKEDYLDSLVSSYGSDKEGMKRQFRKDVKLV